MTPPISRAEICLVACADAFAGDGAVLVSPIGLVPRLGALLAQQTSNPALLVSDGESGLLNAAGEVEAWLPFRDIFDVVWSGRRHVMMGASQLGPDGDQNLSAIGDWRRPRVQLIGARGAPGNTICHATSYFIGDHNKKVFVPQVDVVCGVGHRRAASLSPATRRSHRLRQVITNLGVFDFGGVNHRLRLLSLHPGVSAARVREQTGFEVEIPEQVPQTRLPTEQERLILQSVLDPSGRAAAEVAP